MTKNLEGQQVLILPEGATRVLGRDAQRTNIAVALAVAMAIKSTLGPKGMDKMLVSELGDIVITNDGATILEEMHVEHPIAKLMVEIAKTQDKEVGDGTTTAVLLTGMLLKKAGELLDQNIHPSTIVKGYDLAARKAQEVLLKLSKPANVNETNTLMKIASVSMGSKTVGVGESKDLLAKLVVDAVKMVAEEKNGKTVVDTELIKLEKKEGGNTENTELIKGIVIDKEVVHSGMPKSVKNAKIAIIDCPLEIEKTETDAKIEITSPEQLCDFLEQEEKMLKEMVDKVIKSGATVLFCQKGIDDLAQHYLAKAGILAARRVKKSDIDKLSRATGARIVSNLNDLTSKDLGYAELVEEKKIAGEAMIFVTGCRDPKSVTIFIRGGTEHVVNETERALKDAIGAIASTVEEGNYVTGGGSIEIALSLRLNDYASQIGGREQLAIQAFAEALESVPKTLAENAGMDAIDALVELRAKHKEGSPSYGVNVYTGKIDNMEEQGVIEPTKVKKQAIASAYEAAKMILRIDDMIASKSKGPSSSDKPNLDSGGSDLD